MSTSTDQIAEHLDERIPELRIDVVGGPHRGDHWKLKQNHISIGRGKNNDVILGEDAHLSRSHLVLTFLDGSWTVSDSDSCNGTYMKLSSQFLKIVNRVDVYQSSLLQIGRTSITMKWAV